MTKDLLFIEGEIASTLLQLRLQAYDSLSAGFRSIRCEPSLAAFLISNGIDQSQCDVKKTIAAIVLVAGTLAFIIVLATSFARVTDDEICQLFYPGASSH